MKKGISLIVLVITIIVMIIIAGAIILSLSGSNVTARANLATLLSDRANYQAAYATKYAENTNADGTVTEVTATDIKLPSGEQTYGTWSLDNGVVKFTIKANVDLQKTYGLTASDIGATGKYTWITQAST